MHVSALIIFDPSTMEGGYSFEKLKEFVRGRLHLVPPFQQRLARVPLNLAQPLWVRDEVDLDYHFHRVAVPAPGGPAEFNALAGDILSRQLDRNRPLWEMWVVEGLENGHVGVVAKMHHSTIDGVSGAELMVHLLDLEPNPAPTPPPTEEELAPEQLPSDLELIGHAVVSRLRRPAQLTRLLPMTVKAVASVVSQVRSDDGHASSAPIPFNAPRTPWNAALTAHRSVAISSVPLDEMKEVKQAFGATINDVVLAVSGGALRKYLESKDVLPEKSLIGVAPVSVRTDENKADLGTKVSAMFVSLGTDIEDPVERLAFIHEASLGAKEVQQAVGASILTDWTEYPTPNAFNLGARLILRSGFLARVPPIHNVVISNVPGPPFPLYFAGAKIAALHPMGPIFDGAGLNITVLSYIDRVDFGFVASRELIPDLQAMADLVPDAFGELKKAAAQVSRPKAGAKKK
jgi:WS/DGAT/MGAT family acyltransferase